MSYDYIYIFVRKDLPPEQIVVQAAHASLEVARSFIKDDRRYKIICLGIRSLPKLESVIKELQENSIEHVVFSEPDLSWEKTAVGTRPLTEDQKKIFSRYRLL